MCPILLSRHLRLHEAFDVLVILLTHRSCITKLKLQISWIHRQNCEWLLLPLTVPLAFWVNSLWTLFLSFMCMGVLLECMCTMCIWYSRGPENPKTKTKPTKNPQQTKIKKKKHAWAKCGGVISFNLKYLEGRSKFISRSSRPAWNIKRVLGKPRLYNDILAQRKQQLPFWAKNMAWVWTV